MSREEVKKLFGGIEKDEKLKGNFTELIREHTRETEKMLAEKIAELGRSSGFEFSKDDLFAARAELMDKINANEELNDNDLATVSGGGVSGKITFGVSMALSMASFGTCYIGYGVISGVYAKREGGCAGAISISKEC